MMIPVYENTWFRGNTILDEYAINGVEFINARTQLLQTLANLPCIYRPRAFGGLGLWYSMRPILGWKRPTRPFGWRFIKVDNQAAAILLPAWIYWPVRWWRNRYNVCDWGHLAGFFRMEEGGDYRDGHWTLRFWESFHLMRAEWCLNYKHDLPPDPLNQWERLGRWVERQIARWNRTMPRWTA